MAQRFNINTIPGRYEDRVFVGGNYDSMPVLREIEKYAAQTHFTPILAYDCDMPVAFLHDYTLLLLHSCRYAIFDVTRPSGELMELERIKDYGTNALVVYQVKSAEEALKVPGQISQMLTTVQNVFKYGYHDFETLSKYIQRWLVPQFVFGSMFPTVATQAILGRDITPDEKKIYESLIENRQANEYQIASYIFQSDEYKNLPEEKKTNKVFIESLFKNLLQREPKVEEFQIALNNLDAHLTTKQQLIIDFLQLDEVCKEIEKGVQQNRAHIASQPEGSV